MVHHTPHIDLCKHNDDPAKTMRKLAEKTMTSETCHAKYTSATTTAMVSPAKISVKIQCILKSEQTLVV
jgi:hypothetical protein